jgi:LacI family transcriptional regulator
MPTIYDVAREAQVSLATVSAVMNNSAYVSPGLRERVTSAVRKLGYQPNLVARGLATARTRTLGVIVPNIANPFWPEVVRGIEDRAHAHGYTVLLASSDDERERETLYLRLFLSKRVDGVIVTKTAGALDADVARRLRHTGIPVVQLMRTTSALRGDKVLVDDAGGSYEAVAHLLRLGRRRIAMINGITRVSTAAARLRGYRAALKDARRPYDASLVAQGEFRVDPGYDAAVRLLKRRPDAFFVANYLMTVGLMRALRQYQLRCPEDVAIVTCDDYAWMDAFHPRLTTVNLPKYELGRAGADALLERLSGEGRPRSRTIVLRTSLCLRESCGFELQRPATARARARTSR